MIHTRRTFAHVLLIVAHRYERGQLDTDVVRRLMNDLRRLSGYMRDEQARRFLLRVVRTLREAGRDIQRGSPDPAHRARVAQMLRVQGQRMSNLRM